MKFKDKDGRVFEDSTGMWEDFCGITNNCFKCCISAKKTGKKLSCNDFVREYPIEAARLMGYEVVEEESTMSQANQTESVNCGSSKPRKCDRCGREFVADYPQYLCQKCDMELEEEVNGKKKPLKDWTLGEAVAECKKHKSCEDACLFCYITELEGRCRLWNDGCGPSIGWDLTEKPRFTEQEVVFMKFLEAVLPGIRLIRHGNNVLSWAGPEDSDAESYENNCLPYKSFPSILPGQSVLLSDIVGGGK